MSTRLDRLISLLETGSNAQIKSTAAKQLGEIARRTFGVGGSSIEGGARPSISPDSTTADIKPNKDALNSDTAALGSGLETDAEWAEMMDLIGRVIPHLRSKSYDTRTAAALAIEQIAHAVPVWTPPASALSTADPSSSAATALCPEDTKPPTPFSLAPLLLPSHPKLLGSSGKEYAPPAVPTTREEIEAGKREVMKRLGIGAGAGDIDLGGMGDIVKEELAGGVSSSNPDSPANLTTGEESPAAAAVPLLSLHAKGKEKALSAAALKRQEKERMEEEKKKELAEGEAAGLSARQLNALKRKRKMGGGAATAAAPPPPVKPRLDASSPKGSSPSTSNPTTPSASNGPSSERVVIDPQAKAAARAAAEAAAEAGGAVVAPGKPSPGAALVVERDEAGRERWPWTRIVESLEVGLFSANWEVRHGSAMGLRDILKIQGAAAGTVVGYPLSLNALCNSNALLAHSQSLLTLLALDRFGDFNSDQVVAPVREVAAQALAAILIHMSAESVRTVHEVLVAMVRQDWLVTAPGSNHPDKGLGYAWEVRHAGLLGLKYEVAVRGDLVAAVGAAPSEVKVEGTSSGVKVEAEDVKMEEGDALAGKTAGTMLGDVIETAILGLGDNDDDVRSVSAACLQPIAALIATQLPAELTRVSEVLWNALSEGGDELGSSTGGVMDLLGKFIAYPRYIDILKTGTLSLNDLIPRLYPFFRHTIVAVRLAVPQALHLFLTSPAIQTIDWVDARLFRFLYQNLIIEERYEIRTATLQTWVALLDKIGRTSSTTEAAEQFLEAHTKAFLGEWVAIAMSPPGVPLDANLFLKAAAMAPARVSKTCKAADAQAISHNVDKNAMAQDLSLISADEVLKNRIDAAQALALLVHEHGSEALATDLTRLILDHLGSTSAHQIVIASIIIEEWARAVDARKTAAGGSPLPEANSVALADALLVMLEGQVPTAYYEMLLILSQAYGECQGLLSAFVTDGKIPQSVIPVLPTSLDPTSPPAELFTVDVAGQVAGSTFDALVKRLGKAPAKTALPMLKERQMKIVSSIGYYMAMKDKHDRQVSAAVAGAVIALRVLPGKLNPVIRSIMNGVKLEENADIQARFANAVVSFIAFCSSPAAAIKSNPTEKIVKNLCTFLCQDITRTPVFASAKGTLEGILSDAGVATTTILRGKEVPVVESEEVMAVRVMRRGAELALAELGRRFGPRLFEAVPKLWSNISSVLIETFSPGIDAADEQLADSDRHGQDIIDSFSTLSTVAGQVDLALHDQLANLLPVCLVALQSRFAVIRYAAAHAITSLCDVATVRAMRDVVETLLPFVGDPSAVKRQGAVQAVSLIVRTLDTKALPYVIFLIVPILGRMSDPDDTVRVASTSAFAALVKLVPLEAGIPDPIGFSPEMLERRADERQFLHQLLDGSKVDQYQIPVPIKAELRKYQQDGVNWLAFLAKYQLHGILCDDMGLGKSLQSLCILASKHHERAERFKSTGSPDTVHLPSVIVCPPTLTGHWYHEILKFTENLRPVLYVGSLRDRTHLQTSLTSYDVVIMSYDVVRNDIAYLGGIHWNYCILDEGHIIKNGKTKLTQAVKMLRANYRLILSGTPIQNNVLELWSLFDFLMPGFLGSERSFNERFGKPITANRDGKATAREREAAVLALDALHKQVLPFLLRRLKEDVLADLPPKIIQDYYCDLSDVQKQLYDDFGRSTAGEQIGEIVSTSGGGKGQPHVFQSLQYLRKLCNHPCLVAQEADYPAIVSKVKATGGTAGPNSIRDLENAPKLSALKQILTDCGIGAPSLAASSEVDDLSLASAIPQHRVLIFCQLKTMLDVIEKDLFHAHMPSLSYMRMDGSTDPSKRHGVVQTFNSDPSIDVLLLTTQVGGLGLNLTGADTVIFVEHDWNPQKDLQAMDRAHRLGQKKVVNVYRLITKGTLEEKIMGLQRFKLNIANSVVNQQNAGLESMATDNVLDLFKISTGEEDAADAARKKAEAAERGGPVSQKSLLDGLEDLPAEDEYGGLGMDSFLSGLGGQS